AVSAELLNNLAHFGFVENADLSKSQRGAILRGEIFDLTGELESGRKICTHCDDAMIGKQTRLAAVQGSKRGVGKLLCTEGVIRRATDVGAARNRDHIMKCRN